MQIVIDYGGILITCLIIGIIVGFILGRLSDGG